MVAQLIASTPGGLDGLEASVNDLAVEPREAIIRRPLADDLVRLRRQIDRLEAEFIRRLSAFDHNQEGLVEGGVSTVSWVRAACALSGSAATERVRMARALEDLPQVMESFRAGRTQFCNASLIARLASEVGSEAVQTVESTLVTAGERLDPGRMRRLTEFTLHRLDSDGALDRDNRNHDRRWFSCDQTYGGVFVLRGQLDAESGALVKSALESLCGVRTPNDERSGCQRRADALVELASRQLKMGDLPQTHGQRPHVTLTVSRSELLHRAGEGAADLDGVVVHTETARRIACDSVVSVVTVDDTGRPLSVGRATRTTPPHLRTALALRDKGCRVPGCDRPPGWTDAHHLRQWEDLGETSIDNLISLCRRHHRMVHERGWRITFDPVANTVEVVEPDGTHVGPRRL